MTFLGLSEREYEIAKCLALDWSTASICNKFQLSVEATHDYRECICDKLNVTKYQQIGEVMSNHKLRQLTKLILGDQEHPSVWDAADAAMAALQTKERAA